MIVLATLLVGQMVIRRRRSGIAPVVLLRSALALSMLVPIGQAWAGETLQYDARGNIKGRTVDGRASTYNYDALDRIKSETGKAAQAFCYDANGNRTCDRSALVAQGRVEHARHRVGTAALRRTHARTHARAERPGGLQVRQPRQQTDEHRERALPAFARNPLHENGVRPAASSLRHIKMNMFHFFGAFRMLAPQQRLDRAVTTRSAEGRLNTGSATADHRPWPPRWQGDKLGISHE